MSSKWISNYLEAGKSPQNGRPTTWKPSECSKQNDKERFTYT
ncbi:hypothetical protein HMPREF0658_0035 [Hoylesella marshii DSM 16973 = JCM 13450]|uniref:Uncharacterized protein n=1 Tax=Hoylesella marshii DSM 16973 = JCM 13450 TaxID=862515 RepID=E0NPD4_9BACT|nr:hypothetical protein HMPREF0658_0035 [Hoylesella marshii DSM 16973 = JCM 13450]